MQLKQHKKWNLIISKGLWYISVGYILLSLIIVFTRGTGHSEQITPKYSQDHTELLETKKMHVLLDKDNLDIVECKVNLMDDSLLPVITPRLNQHDSSLVKGANSIFTRWKINDNLINEVYHLKNKTQDRIVYEADAEEFKITKEIILADTNNISIVDTLEFKDETKEQNITNKDQNITNICYMLNANKNSIFDENTKMEDFFYRGIDGVILYEPYSNYVKSGIFASIKRKFLNIKEHWFDKKGLFNKYYNEFSTVLSEKGVVGYVRKGAVRLYLNTTDKDENIKKSVIVQGMYKEIPKQERLNVIAIRNNYNTNENTRKIVNTSNIFIAPIEENALKPISKIGLMNYGLFSPITRRAYKVIVFLIETLGVLATAAILYISLEAILFLPIFNIDNMLKSIKVNIMEIMFNINKLIAYVIVFVAVVFGRFLVRGIIGSIITKCIYSYLPLINKSLLWNKSGLLLDRIRFFSVGGIFNIENFILWVKDLPEHIYIPFYKLSQVGFIKAILSNSLVNWLSYQYVIKTLLFLIKLIPKFIGYILSYILTWLLNISLTGFITAMLISLIMQRVFLTIFGLYGSNLNLLKTFNNYLSPDKNTSGGNILIEKEFVGFQLTDIIIIILYSNSSMLNSCIYIIWMLVLLGANIIRKRM